MLRLAVIFVCVVGGGGGGGQGPPIIFERRGGGQGPPIIFERRDNIPFAPTPNNPPTFSFNFYVKQKKTHKCTKLKGKIIMNITLI